MIPSRLSRRSLRLPICFTFVLAAMLSLAVALAGNVSAAAPTARELLPPSVVAYAEAIDLGAIATMVLEHPLRHRLESLPAYEAAMASSDFAKVQQAIGAFEASMGQPWSEALSVLTDGGISIALDSAEGGMAMLIKSSDIQKLERFRNFVLAIGRMQQGQGLATDQTEYRGIAVYKLSGKAKMASFDHWLLITNSSSLGKSVIDHFLDGAGDSLQTSERLSGAFTALDLANAAKGQVTALVDVAALREAGMAKALANERTENPLAELVLGGILANLRETPYVTAALDLRRQGLQLRLSTPHDRGWEPPREYYFGSEGDRAAPPLLDVEHRMFAISAHRDLSQMWLRAGDLMTDKANDGLAKADTQLTTFFSGRDFGEDILGSLESDIQIVGCLQDFSGVQPQPAIKLPAFALQFRMKNPGETQPELRRVFQSFVGFLNVVGAMNGQPQLDLQLESIGQSQFVFATYIPERDAQESTTAPINFNFSPTLAFAGERIVLSSSTSLARELLADDSTAATDASGAAAGDSVNAIAIIEAEPIQQILEVNKPQLVANNMLEKGHSKAAAEQEIGWLLELVGFLKDAQLGLTVNDSQMQLTAELNVDSDQLE
ncbi:MAG: hypothetical protein ACO1RT_11255 [Planctomycetaceae bacterium]